MFRLCFLFVLGLGLIVSEAYAQSPSPVLPSQNSWSQIVTDDGRVVGTINTQTTIVDGMETSRNEQHVAFLDQNDRAHRLIDITERRNDARGRPISYEIEHRVGTHRTVTTIMIKGDQAQVRRVSGDDARNWTILIPQNIRFDHGGGLIKDWNWDAEPELRFENFNPTSQQVESLILRAHHDEASGNMKIVRSRLINGQLQGAATLWFNRERQLLYQEQVIGGLAVRINPAPALNSHVGNAVVRPVNSLMIKSPYRIRPGALQGHIRYRFKLPNMITASFPETGEQRVSSQAGDWVFDICAQCGPAPKADVTVLEEAKQATPWLQSDHPKIMRLARPVRNMKASDKRKLELLAIVARNRMKNIDFIGHFSALDALARQRGDCTEDAVVLAALGRAAGIPTKVASGLVYTRESYHGVSNAFMPHSWTLAWIDGRWQSFDMSLGGFDATHIALTIGDGDPASIGAANRLAGLLIWDQMAQIK